jgi:hypothetical protein
MQQNAAAVTALLEADLGRHQHSPLQEELKYPVHLIEMQLAHRAADMHGRAYNRTEFIEDRREMMQAWADYLTTIKSKH